MITSDPKAGALAIKHSDVLLFVSIGSGTVTVPPVVGDILLEATAGLKARGLRVKVTPAGATQLWRVIGQSPPGGARLAPGSTVSLQTAPPRG